MICSIPIANLSGQVSITCLKNAMVPGDVTSTREIAWVDPGGEGEEQLWDFSRVHFTGKINYGEFREDTAEHAPGTKEKTLILSQDGYGYRYRLGQDGCEEIGFANASKMVTMVYSDPVVRMKYPFSYGQHFSDQFSGSNLYNGRSSFDVQGSFSVSADGWGTLVLPDRIIRNALRIKTVRQVLQSGVCGSTRSVSEKYYWYAPGYRYPVCMVGTMESIYGGNDPVTVRSAWIDTDQAETAATASSTAPADPAVMMDETVIVYPNPFSDQLAYRYFLPERVSVSIDLYDLSGKMLLTARNAQDQPAGLHTGMLQCLTPALSPGIYYLRFTFDREVVIRKVVKI